MATKSYEMMKGRGRKLMLAGLFFKKDEHFVGQLKGPERELWPRFEGRGGVKDGVQTI